MDSCPNGGMYCFQTFQTPIQFDVDRGALDTLKQTEGDSPQDFNSKLYWLEKHTTN